jgi:hypothetical protein
MIREWRISKKTAKYYKLKFDNGPDSIMAKWRASRKKKEIQAAGIPFLAWLYLAGPFESDKVIVVASPNSKRDDFSNDEKLTKPKKHKKPNDEFNEPNHCNDVDEFNENDNVTNNVVHSFVTDITPECLRLLVNNGFDATIAAELVSKCKLQSTRYINRPSVHRHLTVPNHPTKRLTSLVTWVQAMKAAYLIS